MHTTYTPPPPVLDLEDWPAHERQHARLCYALEYGIDAFTISQLEDADRAALVAVAALPAHLDEQPAAATLDATLHTLRLRIAARIASKRAQLAAINRALAEMGPEPGDEPDAPQAPGQPPETDADRAARLLRAALTLIMGQQPGQGGGGRRAPLQPPPPVRPGPPGGTHANDPGTAARVAATEVQLRQHQHRTPADDIAF